METEPSLVGAVLADKYKIVKMLGEGGMGRVYLGEQTLGMTTRKVAVKVLHSHLSGDEKVRARFMRECGTVAELEHPNTIQVYDFGTTKGGVLYIVMEYVQGESLATLIEQTGAFPYKRVQHILRQVCGSLEEAHARQIVHRDLKPENVVLCEKAGQKDWVEVLDFGIAKRSTENEPNEMRLTQQGMILGTPPYMSPEQFTGKEVDARSDIYSLAIMTYEMLTGQLPFAANTAWEWATQHMTVEPRSFDSQVMGPHIPEAMKYAVMRGLAKEPSDRFSSVRDYFDALSEASSLAPAPVIDHEVARAKTELAMPTAVATEWPAERPKPNVGQQLPVPVEASYGAYAGPAPADGSLGVGVSYHSKQDKVEKKNRVNRNLIGFGLFAVLVCAGGGVVLSTKEWGSHSRPAPESLPLVRADKASLTSSSEPRGAAVAMPQEAALPELSELKSGPHHSHYGGGEKREAQTVPVKVAGGVGNKSKSHSSPSPPSPSTMGLPSKSSPVPPTAKMPSSPSLPSSSPPVLAPVFRSINPGSVQDVATVACASAAKYKTGNPVLFDRFAEACRRAGGVVP